MCGAPRRRGRSPAAPRRCPAATRRRSRTPRRRRRSCARARRRARRRPAAPRGYSRSISLPKSATSGGTSSRSLGASTWNIGSSGDGPPPEGLRLRELHEHRLHAGDERGEEREGPARERDAVDWYVGGRQPCPSDEHAPRPPREERGRRRARRCPRRGWRRRSAWTSCATARPPTRSGRRATRTRGRVAFLARGDHGDAPLGDPLERLRQRARAPARRMRCGASASSSSLEHRDGRLRDDRPGVRAGVDEVHGAAGDADAVLEGLRLRVHAGEGGQERGVDVDDAHREGVESITWVSRRMKPARTTYSTPRAQEHLDDALRRTPRGPRYSW